MAYYKSSARYTQDSSGISSSRKALRTGRYLEYRVKDGDTLENLAFRLFGDRMRYWEIADMNPQIKYPLDLVVGETIRLPQ